MSTKQQTTSNNSTAFQFDPSALNSYHNFLNTWGSKATDFVNNPYNNSQFNMESTLGRDQAGRMGQRYTQNILNNSAAAGYGNNMPGFQTAMLNQAGRATGGLQANAFRGAVGNANQRQMQSMGMLSSFQPLMTGSNSQGQQTQTTSGTGTWLPQVIGAGLGAASSFASMGASGAAGAGSAGSSVAAGLGGAANAFSSSMAPSYNGVVGGYPGMAPNMNGLNGLMPQGQAPGYGAYN